MPSGRFAPSPTGRLHLGNLRTALVAWLFARSDASPFLLRYDDLDAEAVRPEHYATQAGDLLALGLDWDGEPIRQSRRLDHYRQAVEQLRAAGAVYPCYCSRREIREAAQAPNGLAGHHYPGTCRDLTAAQRRRQERSGRPPALRLRAGAMTVGFHDLLAGPAVHQVDDFVVMRNDGTPAYHLVTVVDDAELAVQLVVRGDDLLPSTSRQLLLARILGRPAPSHAHLPLVLSPGGERLAKRHGAVDLDDRSARGESPGQVLAFLARSLGLADGPGPVTPSELLASFDPSRLPRQPLRLDPSYLAPPL